MIRTLTPPSAGQPIRASFFAELLREVRANRPLPGKNTRTKRTPNGTHISADVPEAPKSQPKLPGCWEMKLSGNSEDGYTADFTNRYYSVGGRTYEATTQTLEDLTGTEIIAVKISADAETTQPTPELTSYADLGEMQADQGDEYVYVIPLYKIEDGKITCDFRLGRVSAMWEFPS